METEFAEQAQPPKAPVTGKVFGGHRQTMTSTQTLPPLPSLHLGPDGQPVEEVVAQAPPQHEAADDEGAEEEASSVPQGPPIDQQIIEEAQARAQQILAEAQNMANQMMEQAQVQARTMVEQTATQIQEAAEQAQQQARESGYQTGLEEGRESGSVAATQELRQYIIQARDLYVQAIKQRQLLISTCEPQLARLATKVAERILGLELTTNRDAIVGVVKQALSGLGDREEVSVRVSPEDYDRAAANRAVFEKMVEGLKKFDIVADPAIDPGGCSIETNLGNVDARLSTQLAVLEAALDAAATNDDRAIREAVEEMEVELPDIVSVPDEEYSDAEYAPVDGEYSDEEVYTEPVEEE